MSDAIPETPLTPEEAENIRNFAVGSGDIGKPPEFSITDSLAQQWTAIPADQPVQFTLTRGDLDRLFFAYEQLVISLSMTHESLRRMSRNDTASANTFFEKARELVNSSDNNFRRFFAAIMGSARSG